MRKNANSRKPLLSTRKKKMREKTLFKASTASLIRRSTSKMPQMITKKKKMHPLP